jgi:hypothetical protein
MSAKIEIWDKVFEVGDEIIFTKANPYGTWIKNFQKWDVFTILKYEEGKITLKKDNVEEEIQLNTHVLFECVDVYSDALSAILNEDAFDFSEVKDKYLQIDSVWFEGIKKDNRFAPERVNLFFQTLEAIGKESKRSYAYRPNVRSEVGFTVIGRNNGKVILNWINGRFEINQDDFRNFYYVLREMKRLKVCEQDDFRIMNNY